MYGLVNRALEDLIVQRYGEERWLEVRDKAKVEIDAFISNEPYEDEITYNLIGAAHETLGVCVSDLMLEFGHSWVMKTALENYGPMLRATGATLKEFLVNLPQLHTRVQLLYPKLRPPEFECTDVEDGSLKLHYRTYREGLTNFVVGLLHGLGQLYETPVTVSVLEEKAKGADHDVFQVKWIPLTAQDAHGD
jgi:hypothetical protein